jgi:Ca-activated chloride channel family protein
MRTGIVCLLVLAGAFCRAQEPIRVDVKLVNVAFSVRDSRGALVDDLTKDDFDMFEDAVPQKVSFFARSADVPLTLGLIVDASGSQERYSKQHQHDLEVFLRDVLGPRDRVFLVCFGNHLRLVSDFSQSSSDLIAKFEKYGHHDSHIPELGPKQDREMGTAFYDSIYYATVEKLANESGRRALLVFSDGEDNSSSHDMMTTIEAAQAANVQVYTIRYTEKEHGKLTARNQYGIRVMERIAKETGGTPIDAETTDPHTYFHQIAEELRSSYELAYYPTNAAKDDTFRKTVIRPKPPGLTVHAKTGYFSR